MGKVVIGDCRLCPAKGVRLLNSHIVPSAAYRRAKDGPPGEPRETSLVMVSADGSFLTDKQVREHLLCADCEDRFGKLETYTMPFLSQGDGSFPWLASVTKEGSGTWGRAPTLDVDKLSRFAASLFWRMAVSQEWQKGGLGRDRVKLGPYEPAFRSYLLSASPFPDDAVLFIVLLDGSQAAIGRADRSFTSFKSTSTGGHHIHRFAILGADMRLFVGAGVPRDFFQTCFARSGIVALRPSDNLALDMREMAVKSQAKGKLALRDRLGR